MVIELSVLRDGDSSVGARVHAARGERRVAVARDAAQRRDIALERVEQRPRTAHPLFARKRRPGDALCARQCD